MSDEMQYPQGDDRNRQPRKWTPQQIRALRDHLKLTQSQMAEELQVRQQTISEWETGTHTPHRSTQKTLSMIAERAGFFYRVDQPQENSDADAANQNGVSDTPSQVGKENEEASDQGSGSAGSTD